MYDLTRHRDTSIRTLDFRIVPKSRFLLYSGLCWPVLLFLTHQPNRGGYEKSGGCPPVGVRFPYGRLSSQLNYVPLGHTRYANTVAQERNPPGVARLVSFKHRYYTSKLYCRCLYIEAGCNWDNCYRCLKTILFWLRTRPQHGKTSSSI